MISADLSLLLAELEDHVKEVERRLEQMVRGFMYEFTIIAVNNTPLGDASPDKDGGYLSYYLHRQQTLGLDPTEGYSQGNWNISNGSITQQPIYSGDEAINLARRELQQYKLGQTVVLGNATPYLQNIKVRGGGGSIINIDATIVKPTIDTVMQTHKINLLNYYKLN